MAIAADTDPILPRVTCRMMPCPLHFAGNMCPNENSEEVLEMVNQSFGMLLGISAKVSLAELISSKICILKLFSWCYRYLWLLILQC